MSYENKTSNILQYVFRWKKAVGPTEAQKIPS